MSLELHLLLTITINSVIVNFMFSLYSKSEFTIGFAAKYGVDVIGDLQQLGNLTPILGRVDNNGSFVSHIFDTSGADYYYSYIDYRDSNSITRAGRVIARISTGQRTKLAYWQKTAKSQRINIHRGAGYLIIGNPYDQDLAGTFNTTMYPVDPDVTPYVYLPPGRFYTLQAASWTPETFVVSALSTIDEQGNWDSKELTLHPGEETLLTPDGIIDVPDEFVAANFM
jgi:hypothetical protein